jgi:spore coat protein U-like protein
MSLRLLLALCLLIAPLAGHGQNCTLNIGNMSFGTVTGAGGDSSSNFVFDCNISGTQPLMRVCISIGEPVAPGDVRNRRLVAPPSAQLLYNLYSDSARTQVWGSISSTLPPPTLDYVVSGGKVHATIPIYGRIASGQNAAPAGNYSSTFAPSYIQVGIAPYATLPPSCANIPVVPAITQSSMYINANLAADCTISATTVDFGQQGALTIASDSNGTVTARCGGGVSYSLAMSAGTGAGATVNNRKMSRSGASDTLQYGLYINSARSTVWGDGTSGSTTVGGSGTGTDQTYTVYARLPAQSPAPRPGSYSDTITLTITY